MALALLATALLALLPAALVAPPASADTPGISSQVLHNGSPLVAGAVVTEGDVISLKVQYDTRVEPGSSHTFRLGGAVTLQSVPAGNAAVASIVQDATDPDLVTVTFKDPWPADVNQGVFELTYVVSDVAATGSAPVDWAIDDDEDSVDVIVRNAGDEPENVTDSWGKSVSPGNLNNRVSVAIDPDSGFYELTIDPALESDELSYTLRISSDDDAPRTAYAVEDDLPAGYGYVAGSFEYRTTTWDASGWNKTTSDWAPWTPSVTADTTNGDTLAGTIDLPAKSITEIRYRASINNWPLVQARIQDAFDTRPGAPGPGRFSTVWTNTAEFGSEVTRTATLEIAGNAPGPVPGQAFDKGSDWPSASDPEGELTVDTAPDGTLSPALDIRYTLGADLGQWDGRNIYYTLDRNVVIEDELPAQLAWNTSAADVITLAPGSVLFDGTWDAPGAPLAGLTEIACPATRADFALTAVGSWCIEGQRLWVNVGQDPQTDLVVQARAQLTTTAGLEQAGDSPIVDGIRYRVRNVGDFYHRDDAQETRDDFLVVRPQDQTGGVDDSRAFRKARVGSGEIAVQPGETADVPYRFTVNTAVTGIPVSDTRIVDHVDTSVFDIDDLASLPVTGDYAGTALVASDFALSREGDDLVIRLSPTGVAKATASDGTLVVNLVLTTRPFVGKETMTIVNRATLMGSDGEPRYTSGAQASATSFGNEAEVTKHIFDRADEEWTGRLRAQLAEDGSFVEDIYVYRIAFIPHGSYGNVEISPVVDNLPEAVEFLGFVDEGDVADPETQLLPGPVDLGGNLVVTHDEAEHRVTISQQDGTLYTGGTQAAYFAVRVLDASAPVVNHIEGTSIEATIEPVRPDDPAPQGPGDPEGEAPSLPFTGVSESTPFIAITAALVLGAGIAVVLVARMRRRRI